MINIDVSGVKVYSSVSVKGPSVPKKPPNGKLGQIFKEEVYKGEVIYQVRRRVNGRNFRTFSEYYKKEGGEIR